MSMVKIEWHIISCSIAVLQTSCPSVALIFLGKELIIYFYVRFKRICVDIVGKIRLIFHKMEETERFPFGNQTKS